MAYERFWEEAPERPILSDGSADGYVLLSDISGFYVKQHVTLKSNLISSRVYQIKKIDVYNSRIWLGETGTSINQYSDLSAFTLADSATIKAEKQPKNTVPKDDQAQGTYETEPVVARRVVLVDSNGQKYTQTNPLPVDATVSVVVPPISVDLDAENDSVRLGDGVLLNTLTNIGGKNAIDVNIAGGNFDINIDHTDDSIRLGNGTDFLTSTTIGPSIGLDVNLINTTLPLATGAATETKQDTQITELVAANNNLDAIELLLQNIDTKITNPLPISGTVSVTEPLIVSGTEDGTVLGTERAFVNNQRLQVLASHDREENYTYADFGTKNQRITRVEYSSATFPGIVVRRDFNYILDSGRYKLLDSVWSIV